MALRLITASRARGSLQERFWRKVDKGMHPLGCWLWTGATANYGYGVIGLGSRRAGIARAHVLSYQWAKGEIPPSLKVLHACDNPACVNPEHLSIGTQLQNVRDAIDRGRHTKPPIKKPRINSEQVNEIKDLVCAKLGQRWIAAEYRICRKTVRKIAAGEHPWL